MVLYVDGKEAARTQTASVVEHVNDLSLLVGAAHAATGDRGDYGFDGMIDDLRLYARALSPLELAQPDRLPAPGWTIAARWSAEDFAKDGGTADLDISAGIPQAAQYEVEFKPARGELDVSEALLVIQGQTLAGRVRRIEDRGNVFGLQRIEQVTPETPTILRVRLVPGAAAGGGDILVRSQ